MWGIIIKIILFGMVGFVFISPIPAWAMMIGGAKRVINKTKEAASSGKIKLKGPNLNVNKLNNYFKNGGGQEAFDLPEKILTEEEYQEQNKKPEEEYKKIDIDLSEFANNPVENNNINNPVEVKNNNEDYMKDVIRVDKQELNNEEIKVVDSDIRKEFFSENFWDEDIIKGDTDE